MMKGWSKCLMISFCLFSKRYQAVIIFSSSLNSVNASARFAGVFWWVATFSRRLVITKV